jgi:hypothetical protein
MLSAPRYLLGAADLVLFAGFAWLGASRLRRRLLPDFQGAPASLATLVLALALLLWTAELLGSFGFFHPVPYLAAVAIVGGALRALAPWTSTEPASPAGGVGVGCPPPARSLRRAGLHPSHRLHPFARSRSQRQEGVPPRRQDPRAGMHGLASLISLSIATLAVIHFAANVRLKLGTGMTGFDSTWYHAPLAASFFQSGDTWSLHFLAPQYLAWFYPANAEAFHAVGMLAFHRDLLSPLLNLGWFLACLAALWCLGRPFGAAPWSLALGAVALSVPALADQAGEARNDLAASFFLLAAAAIALNAWDARSEGERGLRAGALIVAGLAAGLAGGTKLTFLMPAAVLVAGLALLAPSGARLRGLSLAGLAALAGGGYWYLRNLAQSGNPFPWVRHLGPIALPGPAQPLGGRESHSVLSYLGDASVWSRWFLPGLHAGLSLLWPLLLALSLAGLVLCLGRRSSPLLRVLGAAGLAAALAWLLAPTGAEGPPGSPRGFESGLRFLTPALVIGLALLPVALPTRLRGAGTGSPPNGRMLKVPVRSGRHLSGRGAARTRLAASVVLIAIAVAIGYPVERHYLRNRYAHPEFTTKGLDAAFAWARSISGAHIGTTATREYPLFGTDLSNRVQFVGLERPHGGFVAPSTCRQWRLALDAGRFDYLVITLDRIASGGPAYPPQARWTEGPGARVILRKPPTVVFQLTAPLTPSACRR